MHYSCDKTVNSHAVFMQKIWYTINQRPGGRLNIKMSSYQDRITMLKIRRSHDRLIFNKGIPIPGKVGLYIATGPWTL